MQRCYMILHETQQRHLLLEKCIIVLNAAKVTHDVQ